MEAREEPPFFYVKTFTGTIERVDVQDPARTVFLFKADDGTAFLAEGAPACPVRAHLAYRIAGDFVYRSGRPVLQFGSLSVQGTAVEKFLIRNCRGVGAVKAKQIVERLGPECLDTIPEYPESLCAVPGISKALAARIGSDLQRVSGQTDGMAIYRFFQFGITDHVMNAVKKYCAENRVTFRAVMRNPYRLCQVPGLGFKRVDAMALAAGVPADSLGRIRAAVQFALETASSRDGHCYLTREELAKELVGILHPAFARLPGPTRSAILKRLTGKDGPAVSGPAVEYQKTVALMDSVIEAQAKLTPREAGLVVDDGRIYTAEAYSTEQYDAEAVRRMLRERPAVTVSRARIAEVLAQAGRDGITYTDEQYAAIQMGLTNRISIITGGPGRGKTSVAQAVVKAVGSRQAILLAPTGKAAKRLEESVAIPGLHGATLHRYCAQHKETADRGKLIIMDECSMLGEHMLKMLLEAGRYCSILFLGDKDQLPSIEPGNVLADLIACRCVPVAYLTRNFRNEGSIAANAAAVNAGSGRLVQDNCFRFIPIPEDTEDDGASIVAAKYLEAVKDVGAENVTVLSPIRKRGGACVDALNDLIRVRNPQYVPGQAFCPGDRVMNTKNAYSQRVVRENGAEEAGLFNGDMGRVDRAFPDGSVDIILDDGGRAHIEAEDVRSRLSLAYATTIHKSQGSEYNTVIIALPPSAGWFMCRKILYTGITRARCRCLIVSTEQTVRMAAYRQRDDARNTRLAALIGGT